MSNFEWLDAIGLDRKNLPQLPERGREMLGLLKPNKDVLCQLPQLAPTLKSETRAENSIASSLEGVDREPNSAAEKDMQMFWMDGFLSC